MNQQPVLDVKGLRTSFLTDSGDIPAVDGIDFYINEGEIVGIVGESGSGKSVTSLSIMGLIPKPPGKVEGEILYKGENLRKASEKRMCQIRGNEVAMIFQEPMTSLNPLFTIGQQLTEAIKLHQKLSRKLLKERTVQMLKLVGLPRAEELLNDYPHQLSQWQWPVILRY
jgi:peptide/nickel transport system ATP-binding protein